MGYMNDPGSITEFQFGVTGGCGPCALAVAEAASEGRRVTNADFGRVLKEVGTPNGITTMSELRAQAEKDGFTVAAFYDYNPNFSPDVWHPLLLNTAGSKAIVAMFDNAQALADALGRGHDERGVHNHFNCIVNKCPQGYITADGDASDPNNYQIYSFQDLKNAGLCALMVLDPKEAVMPFDVAQFPHLGSYLKEHPELGKCVSGGERSYDGVEAWAAFEHGVVALYNGNIHTDLAPYIAVALDNLRVQALAEAAKLPAPAPATKLPSNLQSVLSNALNATAALAQTHTDVADMMKQLGF